MADDAKEPLQVDAVLSALDDALPVQMRSALACTVVGRRTTSARRMPSTGSSTRRPRRSTRCGT
jgi:hypothetical protein